MKNLFVFLLCILLLNLSGVAQPVVFINAGTRASYGQYQELLIDADGSCRFYLWQVNGVAKDSSFFNISRQQLDSFFRKAEQLGFFELKPKYDGGAVDGAGIYISMNYLGKKQVVSLINTDLPAISELVGWLNRVLLPQRIRIYYGQNAGK